jgi:hypothetical protein
VPSLVVDTTAKKKHHLNEQVVLKFSIGVAKIATVIN